MSENREINEHLETIETREMKCEIVRDLMPLAAENLCSGESHEAVETHVGACAPCKEVWGHVQSKTPVAVKPSSETDEITFRKAFGRMIRTIRFGRLLLGLAIALVAVYLLAFAGDLLFWQTNTPLPIASMELSVMRTEENMIVIEYVFDREYTRLMSRVDFDERSGVLLIQHYKPALQWPWAYHRRSSVSFYSEMMFVDGQIRYDRNFTDLFYYNCGHRMHAEEVEEVDLTTLPVIKEIQIESSGEKRTVWKQGDDLPVYTPTTGNNWYWAEMP